MIFPSSFCSLLAHQLHSNLYYPKLRLLDKHNKPTRHYQLMLYILDDHGVLPNPRSISNFAYQSPAQIQICNPLELLTPAQQTKQKKEHKKKRKGRKRN